MTRGSESLMVQLPEPNANFHSLALQLASNLPRDATLPAHKKAAQAWQVERRELLKSILRNQDYEVVAEQTFSQRQGEIVATFYLLRLSNVWTVPALELAPKQSTGTVVIVSDNGRATMAAKANEILNSGRRVVLFDPFYIGDCALAQTYSTG